MTLYRYFLAVSDLLQTIQETLHFISTVLLHLFTYMTVPLTRDRKDLMVPRGSPMVSAIAENEYCCCLYYRGLSEWETEKGWLTDTCLDGQDTFKRLLDD